MPEIVTSGHEIISGTIGMGKSYWVLYKIVKSMMHGRPCCYIDPKGDTFRVLLNFFASTTQGEQLWRALGDRVILVNPIAASEHLVGLNAIEPLAVFESSDPDRLALLANALVSHIRSQSGFDLGDANRMVRRVAE